MTYGFGEEARNYRHGHKPASGATPEYLVWLNMRARCYNSKNNRFHLYGKIGVKVCARWLADFEDFLSDVGMRPTAEHSLDRFPNKNGNYEPGNVRWATQIEQNNNRRSNRLLEFEGEIHTLAEWERIKGFGRGCLHARLKSGWSTKNALTRAPRQLGN